MKTKPTQPSSEPSSDNLTSEAAELKRLIVSGRHKALKKFLKRILKRKVNKKKGLPKDLKKIFFSLSAQVPIQTLIWYVRRFQSDEGFKAIMKHPTQSGIFSFVRNKNFKLKPDMIEEFPKGLRYQLLAAYYQSHELTAEEQLNVVHSCKDKDIICFIKNSNVDICVVKDFIRNKKVSFLEVLVNSHPSEQALEAIRSSRNPKIATLVA